MEGFEYRVSPAAEAGSFGAAPAPRAAVEDTAPARLGIIPRAVRFTRLLDPSSDAAALSGLEGEGWASSRARCERFIFSFRAARLTRPISRASRGEAVRPSQTK